MGSSRFWLKAADEDSKSIPHEFPRSDRSVQNRALPVGDNAKSLNEAKQEENITVSEQFIRSSTDFRSYGLPYGPV